MVAFADLLPNNWMYWFVAVGAHMVVGALWYSPGIFGKKYMALAKKKGKSFKMSSNDMVGTAVLAAITVSVLLCFIRLSGAATPMEGVTVAFYLWLGFIATTKFHSVICANKPVELYVLHVGYHLVALSAAAAVLVYGGL